MLRRTLKRTEAGFTIVETMLFLAVTGVLIATLLGGVGIALNNQRYNDAVQSFKSLLQTQYSDISTVINDRSDDWSCNANAITSQPTSGGTQAQGQSDCFLVGKFVTIVGGSVSTTDVVATQKSGILNQSGDDIAKLTSNYHFSLSTVQTETQDLEWGTEIAWPSSGASTHDTSHAPTTPRSIVMLLIRSPDSGTTYTFTKDPQTSSETNPATVKEADLIAMMVSGNVVPGQGDRLICLDSDGLSTSGNMGFYIEAYATDSSAIQTRSNDTKLVGGSAEC
jgi:type II secretory pathway pseudopilin PulG